MFCNLLTASRTVSNTYARVARVQSRANHVQHIERLSRATCRVPRGTIKFDRVEIAFFIALFHWLKPLADEGVLNFKSLVFLDRDASPGSPALEVDAWPLGHRSYNNRNNDHDNTRG